MVDYETGLEDVLFPWLAMEEPEQEDGDESVIRDEDEQDEQHAEDCAWHEGEECDCDWN